MTEPVADASNRDAPCGPVWSGCELVGFDALDVARPLASGRLGDRWLTLDRRTQLTGMLTRLSGPGVAPRHAAGAALGLAAGHRHNHRLPIDAHRWSHGAWWVLSPYPGSQAGLLTLAGLAGIKGGSLPLTEARRATIQMLAAAADAERLGLPLGPFTNHDWLVDRRGSLLLDLTAAQATGASGLHVGVRRGQHDGHDRSHHAGEPVGVADAHEHARSIARGAYELVTGRPGDAPFVTLGRVAAREERPFLAWIQAGLDPVGGFDSAAEALRAWPAADAPVSPVAVAPPSRSSRAARGWRVWRRRDAATE